MPKLKTHKGTFKRVKKTGDDKLVRRRANGTHFLEKKGTNRKRVIKTKAVITGSNARNIRRALGE